MDKYWSRREQIWTRYMREIAHLPVGLPAAVESNTKHGFHLFTLQIDKESCGLSRDEFIDAMTAQNIGVGVHYMSVPEHIYYRDRFGWKPEDYPHAMKVGRSTVSIPITAKLTDDDVSDVINAISLILG